LSKKDFLIKASLADIIIHFPQISKAAATTVAHRVYLTIPWKRYPFASPPVKGKILPYTSH